MFNLVLKIASFSMVRGLIQVFGRNEKRRDKRKEEGIHVRGGVQYMRAIVKASGLRGVWGEGFNSLFQTPSFSN
jgi:hypothetical protein